MNSSGKFGVYSLVGVGLVFFNYLLFWALYFTLESVLELWSIGSLQYAISVLFSHHVYRKLVFQESKERYTFTLAKYFVSTIAIAALSLSLLLIGHDLLGLKIFIAQGISMGATLGIGFLVGARFTFMERNKIPKHEASGKG